MYTPNAIDRFVGRNMRARRQELGITPDALAVMLSVEIDTVRRFENGEERIRPFLLFTEAKRLHVGVGYFFQDASTRRTAEVIPFRRRGQDARQCVRTAQLATSGIPREGAHASPAPTSAP